MADSLSPQSEAIIRDKLATGFFTSREQVIEAGLNALQQQDEMRLIPLEHEALLEEAEADLAAGRVVEWNFDQIMRDFEERLAKRQQGS
jgi:Arc/MetJ-type ribon-helix-helix transcriptional regulator